MTTTWTIEEALTALTEHLDCEPNDPVEFDFSRSQAREALAVLEGWLRMVREDSDTTGTDNRPEIEQLA